MDTINYDFESQLEQGFQSLFESIDKRLYTADDLDGELPNEHIKIEIDTGGPNSNEHLNAGGQYNNYTGSIEIVIQTPRVADDQVAITKVEGEAVDAYDVTGAGTTEANGLYVRNGDSASGSPVYTMYDSDGVTPVRNMWERLGIWQITTSEVESIGPEGYEYFVADVDGTPPESGWLLVEDGEAPAPIVQATSEIDEIISYWDGARWVGANPSEVAGYPDQNGFRLTSTPSDVVYVAYKKVLPTEYGDGNQGTTSDFPAEWLNYCAYSAAREWMGSVRRDEAFNPCLLYTSPSPRD